MKKMKQIILLAACALSVPLSAQTLKTYSGTYPHAQGSLNGTVKYSYTEAEDGQRIKQGVFSFATPTDQMMAVTVQGTYKDGSKEGKWTTTINRPKSTLRIQAPVNNIESLTTGGLSVMSGNFINDLRTGVWTFIGGKAADKTSRASVKSTASFVDGLIDGPFSYTFEDQNATFGLCYFSVVGALVNGIIDGKWTMKQTDGSKIEEVVTLEFDQGKLMSCKSLNTATGDVTSPVSYNYDGLLFKPTTEPGTKYTLNTYFRQAYPALAYVFQIWMGDPTLSRFDTYLFADTERYSGFAFMPKKK